MLTNQIVQLFLQLCLTVVILFCQYLFRRFKSRQYIINGAHLAFTVLQLPLQHSLHILLLPIKDAQIVVYFSGCFPICLDRLTVLADLVYAHELG